MVIASRYTYNSVFFFFNDTATTEIYTLSLHDALPICRRSPRRSRAGTCPSRPCAWPPPGSRSEEHTSELQSHSDLVCRLLLEKKKKRETDKTVLAIPPPEDTPITIQTEDYALVCRGLY